jgi:hypothetical protein
MCEAMNGINRSLLQSFAERVQKNSNLYGINCSLLQSFAERVQKNSNLYIFEKITINAHYNSGRTSQRTLCASTEKCQRVNAVYGHYSYWR